jgi:hypothetical protein
MRSILVVGFLKSPIHPLNCQQSDPIGASLNIFVNISRHSSV